MIFSTRFVAPHLAVALGVFLLPGAALAVPYASGIHNTTGSMFEFVLNESADLVTITRDGGNPIVINNPTAGRHIFDLESFSEFEISVEKTVPLGWSQISDPANLHTYYFRPNGVVVNKDAASPYFGTVYISHPIAVAPPAPVDREMGEGIYALTADLVGVDLANNLAARTDPDDPTLAILPPGWTTEGNGGFSPWQIALDASGNLIASDYSDQNGGFKYASPDLTTGGLVLAFEDGVRPLLVNGNNEEIHGSILSKPNVTGSVGVDLSIAGIDEDMDIDRDTFENGAPPAEASDDGYSIWRWEVGAATEYDQPPALEIASTAVNVGDALWFDNGDLDGIFKDAHYEPRFNKWYLTQSRTHGNESSLIIVTPDGVDGMSPTIEWSSRGYSLANGLDGAIPTPATDTPEELANIEGPQDVFRSLGSVTISEDGTKMFIHRAHQFDNQSADGANPVLGLESNVPGGIIIVPLDENGLPDLELDDNGTPGDTSDDFFTNLDSIMIASQEVRHVRHPIALDAAGNVYITNNISELLQVFSPGGNTLAITGSDGTFTLTTPMAPGELDGDYNDDGVVNAADYVVFRNNLDQAVTIPNDVTPGMVDQSDYSVWVQNFGSTSGSGVSNAVPEPSTLILFCVLCCGAFCQPRRVRKLRN